MNNWNLTNVSDVSVDLSTADAYHNVGNYTVPEDRMLLITASLNYTQLGGSETLETQSFATIVSSDFLREGGIRYLELDRGQFASSDTNLHDFNARFMLKSQWGSHQLQISREDNGQSPFAPVDSAVYSESNSVRVRVFEVGLELSDDVVTQSAIADDSVGLEQLAHGTANKFLGFDESGNPVEKDGLSSNVADWATEGSMDTIPDSKILDSVARDSEIPDTSDLLNQSQVDARIQANVADWAETGNTAAIPASKVPDDSVGLAQLAHGTANRFLGFDNDGNPAELAAPSGGSSSGWRGQWSAGNYAVGDIVVHDNVFYICRITRTSSNTDNPIADTAGWAMLSGSMNAFTNPPRFHARRVIGELQALRWDTVSGKARETQHFPLNLPDKLSF